MAPAPVKSTTVVGPVDVSLVVDELKHYCIAVAVAVAAVALAHIMSSKSTRRVRVRYYQVEALNSGTIISNHVFHLRSVGVENVRRMSVWVVGG